MKKNLISLGMPLIAMGLLVACGEAQSSPSKASSPNPGSSPAASTPAASSADKSGDSSAASSADGSTPVGELTAVYFKDSAWWANEGGRSGIYLWKDSENHNASWPGEAMESLGNGVWKYTFPADHAYIGLIFTRIGPSDTSDWGAKTPDIVIADINPATPMYDISGVTDPVWGDPGVQGVWTAYAA